MPLLSAEPSVFPHNLFEAPAESPAHHWCVYHTRPRAEKCLARLALRNNARFFLPLHTHRWRNKGRTFSSQLPLFPGYLFVHAEENTRDVLFDRRYVANYIPVVDQDRLWADLKRVHKLIESGRELTPHGPLAAGDRVMINAGPFAGFEGTIIRSGRVMSFVIEVKFIQRAVAIEIEDWMVEPAHQAQIA